MSLAKVLGAKAVDSGLDDIFKSSAGPSTLILPINVRTAEEHSRKRKTDASSPSEEDRSKKTRASKDDVRKSKREVKERKAKVVVSGHEETIAEVKADKGKDVVPSDAPDSDDESDPDTPLPKHESHEKSNRRKASAKKAKFVPDGETHEQRDARSIFIGNLPVAVVKSKAMTKQLKRHILSYVPSASIESIRYRSVAFLNPTSALEPEDGSLKKPKPSTKELRQKKRASDWRDQKPDSGWAGGASKRDEEEAAEDRKGIKDYMTPAAKRKLAAIKGDVHEHEAATTNAYVVFAYPIPSVSGSELNVPRKEVMDPIEAARTAVRAVDGTIFEGHVVRVDIVGNAPAEAGAKEDGVGALTDPRMSIFAGNLDFASSEDDVRAFFEKIIIDERGNPVEAPTANGNTEEEEDDEPNQETKTPRKAAWVTRVRIVRDRETQLGKGFAYVQFSDRDCVDEVLALEAEKLKFAKRTLRVQRCKASGVSSKLKKASSSSLPKSKATAGVTTTPRSRSQPAVVMEVPKGDPSLGARLVGLTKASRKEAKSADQARLARRLAKKKARAALEKAGVKEKRVRERRDKNKKGVVNTGRKERKRRVRSEKSDERRNAKK